MSAAANATPLWRLLALVTAILLPGAATAELAIGDPAPNFSLSGSDGVEYRLEALLAKGVPGVVLAWFPKAFTPG
jgi:peroxiredoxin Q/BCP